MRAALQELFDKLPDLQFDESPNTEIEYIRPVLKKPTIRKRRLKDRAESVATHHALVKIFGYLHKGTGKLEYGRTSDEQWRRYMRFPTDRLPVSTNGEFSRIDAEPPEPNIINWTAEAAEAWFTDILIPKIRSARRPQIFIVGEPGSGKSTLMKSLLNLNHNEIRNQRIIFSRFEYLKFKRDWLKSDALRESMDEYISYILLRDAIVFYAYNRHSDYNFIRKEVSRLDEEHLSDLMYPVALDLGVDDRKATGWYQDILNCMPEMNVDLDRLRNVPHKVRAALLSHLDDTRLREGQDYKTTFCLVMDGLDYISIDDLVFDTEQHEVLQHVMERQADLTNFRLDRDRSVFVRSVPIFVMRGNTLESFNKERAIDIVDTSVFQVAPLDPEVTVYNAIRRAADLMVRDDELRPAESAAMVRRLFRSFSFVMSSINRQAKIGPTRRAVYGLFGHNLRTTMEFLHKVFMTVVDDALSSSTLRLPGIHRPAEILNALDSEEGRRIIRRRRYRLIELLLFSYIPWFETAVLYSSDDDDDDAQPRWCRDNPNFTGVVDNVFNYTTTRHPSHPDQHCFLEKVRIIQAIMALETGAIPRRGRSTGREGAGVDRIFPKRAEILAKMRELTGYVPRDIGHSLYLLMRTEMIVVHVGGDGKRGYAVTPMGRAVSGALSRDLSYIEHIFHGTLFPKSLVEGIADDRREVGIDTWTAVSIRNAFIWLTYLRFVENNDANGVAVQPDLRLWEDTKARIHASMSRILGSERNPVPGASQDKVAELAVGEINKTLAVWKKAGVLREAA